MVNSFLKDIFNEPQQEHEKAAPGIMNWAWKYE